MANVYVFGGRQKGMNVYWEVKNWQQRNGEWSTKYVMKHGLAKQFRDRHPQPAKKESNWMEDVRSWTPNGECLNEGKL